MSDRSLAQYSLDELEEYIKARRFVESMEGKSASKVTAVKSAPKKIKAVKTRKRNPINPADVLAAIKKAGSEGISGAKLQAAVGTTFNTFTKWMTEHGKVNNIHKERAKKGPGFVYTIKG